ncbi:MAG: molybdopterin-dependent oxidoreductase [Chloroflexota bacterium]
MASRSEAITTTASGSRLGRTGREALSGLLAAGAALATGELLAGVLPGAPSLVASVAQLVIDLQPPGAKDAAVGLFGTNDKLALEVTIVLVSLALGAAVGLIASSRPAVAVAVFAIAGTVGFAAGLRDPLSQPILAAGTAALSAIVGVQVLGWLLGRARAASAPASTDPARRSFLIGAGTVGAATLMAGLGGRWLVERGRQAPAGASASIPQPAATVAPLAQVADLAPTVPGLTPIVMPNDRFYRIDTSILTPIVDPADWHLRVHGMVDRVVTLDWAQLLALPLFEQYVTIACVSNEVGGRLVGNAKWTGVRLRQVLEMAGVKPGASQLVGRSVDGWTAGMPTAWVMDKAREPMIAVRMNGDPLPPIHGFPARLIVPGLYGYVSATKWLTELELTTLDAFDGYWVPLGWAKEAPILTQSRIDTPGDGGTVPAGRVPVAGIAWAPDRGIGKVEVGIDGHWAEARLSAPISDATWVQWVYDWQATPGRHTVAVRATDGTGTVQTDEESRPAPDGARGWHTIGVNVG